MDVVPMGRSLELYFIDGKADGMLTAEVFNWTGHVLMAPRTQISDALSRKEASYTGIYILIGERGGESLAYIGEAEDIGNRIRSHGTNKDWWDIAVIVTSAANNLNKAHVKYLEARLVQLARAVGRVPLDNSNTPGLPGLSEAGQSNMEVFLDYLLMVLPALRVDLFLSHRRPAMSTTRRTEQEGSQEFELNARMHDLKATAVLEGSDFVVQKGSQARSDWSEGSSEHHYGRLHAELVRTGVLRQEDGHRVFAEDYAFRSPSAAAAVVNGRPASGPTEWKVKGENRTYKEWEADRLASVAQAAK